MKRSLLFSTLALGSLGAVLCACPPGGFGSVCDNGGCDDPDASGDGSALSDGALADGTSLADGSSPTDGGNTIDAPAGCVLSMDPKESPACVADAVGVFVDATNGLDTNDGSKAHPFQTITKAVTANASAKPRVYVCAGAYTDNIAMDQGHAVSIYGGFACSAWTYATSNAVLVKPASGYALDVDTVTSALTIADIELDASDGTSASVNSIAVLVNASPSVSLSRVVMKAGNGFSPTQPGAPTSNFAAGSLDGNNAVDATGAGVKTCMCVDATTTTGGKGGGTAATPAAGTPSHGGGGGTAGANGVACAPTGGGSDGDNGPAPAANATPAHPGTIDAAKGWIPQEGPKGTNGVVGQGGGGGGNGKFSTGGGSSGGCGGCGGAGGLPGAGGGASIALVTVGSPVKLTACTLTAAAPGGGAQGGNAELTGQPPGAAGTLFLTGCPGGNGGAGSGGNGGGGGAGGLSIGLLFSGSAPNVDGSSATTSASHAGFTVAASAGAVGTGGNAGGPATGGVGGNAGPSGALGVAKAIQQAEEL